MKKSTSNIRFIPAKVTGEGAGVIVYRTIGTAALKNHDPFLMLDHFSSDNPADYTAGFPSHPTADLSPLPTYWMAILHIRTAWAMRVTWARAAHSG
ncbi:hypothetical protein [Nitrosomonas sp.]|uniref:hypothetical protein n=1 Tax=Nitrosomonas sp. TaxID=42353 RepID=UPI00283A925B|nr:hypothetical protein [Nitrosomonas sp.]